MPADVQRGARSRSVGLASQRLLERLPMGWPQRCAHDCRSWRSPGTCHRRRPSRASAGAGPGPRLRRHSTRRPGHGRRNCRRSRSRRVRPPKCADRGRRRPWAERRRGSTARRGCSRSSGRDHSSSSQSSTAGARPPRSSARPMRWPTKAWRHRRCRRRALRQAAAAHGRPPRRPPEAAVKAAPRRAAAAVRPKRRCRGRGAKRYRGCRA
mmetsp:Transcript_143646/g.459622  ORF Transcript_143646/g.459622 Transcript_143646/m.459622 type:complete len:210 (+) Transcript_143646:4347-4976(+)